MVSERLLTDPVWWSNFIYDSQFEENLQVSISHDEEQICSITGQNPSYTIQIESNKQELDSALLNCGLAELFFNYTASKNPASIKSATTDANLRSWFKSNLEKKELVVDTNIILDRVFSSLESIGQDCLNSIKVKIPRLSILELESKTNRAKPKSVEKRECFLGYGELMYLKNKGAVPMSELNVETLTGFSKISGEQKTDSWIRREIKDAHHRALRAQVVKNYVLMTSDLVNSFSAVAEDIDTIHVSRINDWKNKIRRPTLIQVGRLINSLGVLLQNISIDINSKKFEVDGMREGKTIQDWGSEYVYHRLLN